MVITLRSLQAAANNQNTEAVVPWRALNSTNQSTGSPMVTYDGFAARWDAEDESGILHQLVDRFDGQGLVLKTDAQSPNTPQGGSEGASQVSQMAKRATKLGK